MIRSFTFHASCVIKDGIVSVEIALRRGKTASEEKCSLSRDGDSPTLNVVNVSKVNDFGYVLLRSIGGDFITVRSEVKLQAYETNGGWSKWGQQKKNKEL